MDMKSQAKLDVLKQIRKIASQAMQDDMKAKGLKKVTVASDSPEGLEAGLEKAKSMLEAGAEGESEETEDMEKMSPEEHMKMMDEGDEQESEEDLDAQIKALEEKKAKLRK